MTPESPSSTDDTARHVDSAAPGRRADLSTPRAAVDLAGDVGAGSGTAAAGDADVGSGADSVVVDARGLICPAPIIALAKAARGLAEGTRVTVLATDPAAAVDVPAWARMRGHRMLDSVSETTEDGEQLVLTVLLGPVQTR